MKQQVLFSLSTLLLVSGITVTAVMPHLTPLSTQHLQSLETWLTVQWQLLQY